MWPGWRDELESNRWHWSKRWAQRLPVVLIQPELPEGIPGRSALEARLPNVEILSVQRTSRNPRHRLTDGLRQAGQIAKYMAARGHQRPLFWFYNPYLVMPFAVLSAKARVFHATENFFQLNNLSSEWLDYCRYAIEASDLLACCSSGVAGELSRQTRQKNILTVPNGCDFAKYSRPCAPQGDWPTKIAKWQASHPRMAVFAGNINYRLDFGLIERLVDGYPQLGFVFAGPLDWENLSAVQRRTWRSLRNKANVQMLGRIPAEDLPALYARCDVGIIPYRTDLPLIVENGFPLKTLEMAAAGLPVVASFMRPLGEVSGAVTIARDAEAFYAALPSHSRRMRSESEHYNTERICKTYDYDALFERMAETLAALVSDIPSRPADLAGLAERIVARVPMRRRLGALLVRIHPEIRRKTPRALRTIARRWFG
jgi:glycosyltransferase involved in cell wall biosynthesis